jgi:hypothetical protein
MCLAEIGEGRNCLGFEEDGIEMNALQSFRCLMAQACDNVSSPIATLSNPFAVCIAQTLHQLCPCSRGAVVVPSWLCRFPGKGITRKCWDDEVKRIAGRAVVRFGINQLIDNVSKLQD